MVTDAGDIWPHYAQHHEDIYLASSSNWTGFVMTDKLAYNMFICPNHAFHVLHNSYLFLSN